MGIPGKLYKDYFNFNNNLLNMPFSICFPTFCDAIQKIVITKTGFLKEAMCSEAIQEHAQIYVISRGPQP